MAAAFVRQKEYFMKVIDICLLYCVAAAFVRQKEISVEIIIYLGRTNYRRRTMCHLKTIQKSSVFSKMMTNENKSSSIISRLLQRDLFKHVS